MARPYVFTVETTLYHPSEGARVFPAGETDPGPAWTDKRGGEPADKGTTRQALKDLIAAQDQIDALGEQLTARDRDLATIGQERDEANAKLGEFEQRAIAAEGKVEAAEQAARGYMVERDSARGEVQALKDKVDGIQGDADRAPGLARRLEAAEIETTNAQAALENANATVTEQDAEIKALKAKIKPVDGDGDGAPGGSKPRAADKA